MSWESLADAFKQSGTKFYRIASDGVTQLEITKPSSNISLAAKETLRIVPPIVNGTPQWWWSVGKTAVTAGTVMWVTKSTVSMASPPKNGGVFEYNVQGGSRWTAVDPKVFWDISTVEYLSNTKPNPTPWPSHYPKNGSYSRGVAKFAEKNK